MSIPPEAVSGPPHDPGSSPRRAAKADYSCRIGVFASNQGDVDHGRRERFAITPAIPGGGFYCTQAKRRANRYEISGEFRVPTIIAAPTTSLPGIVAGVFHALLQCGDARNRPRRVAVSLCACGSRRRGDLASRPASQSSLAVFP